MKNLILLFLILTSQAYAAKGKAPSPEDTEKWVVTAMNADEDKLNTKGPIRCEYPIKMGAENNITAEGKTQDEAATKLGLLCIRYRCNHISESYAQGQSIIQGLSDDEMTAFMHAYGYTDEQISNAIQRRKNPSQQDANVTCLQTSQLSRLYAYDMCFGIAMSCGAK